MPEQERPVVSSGEAGMFLLEIVGLIGVGRLGWHLGDTTLWSLALSALFVSLSGALWAIFRTRGYTPNGQEPVIHVPGPARVIIEYGFYATAALGLWISGWRVAAIVFAAGVALVSWALRDRLAGLLANRIPEA